MSNNLTINTLSVGMSAKSVHKITDEKIRAFAALSGDSNPIHIDDKFAKDSPFKKRIAHGALISSFFSSLFATDLPGPGSIYISQNTKFRKPVYINDEVEAVVEITDIDTNRKRIYFKTYCLVGDTEVLTGTAEIYLP